MKSNAETDADGADANCPLQSALKETDGHGSIADDWQASFDERAGIIEYDGNVTRAEAEALALACCLDRTDKAVIRGGIEETGIGNAIVQETLRHEESEPT